MELASAILNLISVLLAIIVFIWGFNQWRREFIGKRKIELMETVLALFYEAQEAINFIRSPYSPVGEGSTRKKPDQEDERETEALNQAYVFFERYGKKEKTFAELQSKKYQIMAVFGKEYKDPFTTFITTMNEIFNAANQLGSIYWNPNQHVFPLSKREEFLKYKKHYESIVWPMAIEPEEDRINTNIQDAVSKMEKLMEETVGLKDTKNKKL